jgi:hypothetical protein
MKQVPLWMVDDGSEKGSKRGDSFPNAIGMSRLCEHFYKVKMRDTRHLQSLSHADSKQSPPAKGEDRY